jgi:predicted RNase H-like nuclease
VTPRVAVGFDGCPAGWVAVTLVDGRVDSVEVVADLAPAVAVRGPAAIAIDMPIGLVDGIRDADVAARRLLPGRASSVFSTPPRAVVDGWRDGSVATHAQATALAVAVTGKGLSQQAWRLVPKIAEVDDLVETLGDPAGGSVGGAWSVDRHVAGDRPARPTALRQEPGRGRRPATWRAIDQPAEGAVTPGVASPRSVPVLEVHPEVAFTVATGGPLPRKRSWAGVNARRAVLADLDVVLPDRFGGDELAAPDDVVDAAICAWVADGAASGLPLIEVPGAPPQRDRGRPIAILAREPSS